MVAVFLKVKMNYVLYVNCKCASADNHSESKQIILVFGLLQLSVI